MRDTDSDRTMLHVRSSKGDSQTPFTRKKAGEYQRIYQVAPINLSPCPARKPYLNLSYPKQHLAFEKYLM
jgi:hypothetical protein